jgi:hypothetical protein
MGFAPKGLKVGDVFEDCGLKYKIVKVFNNMYESELVREEKQAEQISLADLPFSDVESEEKTEVKKRGKKKAE